MRGDPFMGFIFQPRMNHFALHIFTNQQSYQFMGLLHKTEAPNPVFPGRGKPKPHSPHVSLLYTSHTQTILYFNLLRYELLYPQSFPMFLALLSHSHTANYTQVSSSQQSVFFWRVLFQ